MKPNGIILDEFAAEFAKHWSSRPASGCDEETLQSMLSYDLRARVLPLLVSNFKAKVLSKLKRTLEL